MSCPCSPSVPLPPAGDLRITDVTHSTMRLSWDAAPGKVIKYMVTYTPGDGELKEVPGSFISAALIVAPSNYTSTDCELISTCW